VFFKLILIFFYIKLERYLYKEIMKFSKVFSAQQNLFKAELISIEVDISSGLHKFSIVGLPDKSVEEAKDRVSSALKNSNFESPKNTNHKITISLAPAHLKKSGAIFDLPIAIAYLKAINKINFDESDKIFTGELSLDGRIRPIINIIPIIEFARENKFKEIFIPYQNRREASLIKNIKIIPVKNLQEIIDHLTNKKKILAEKNISINPSRKKTEIDFKNIFGQEKTKRALLISASGGHNIGLYGPPGTGKTMMARALIGILPELDHEKIIETTMIHSYKINKSQEIIINPPFRAPHHSSSYTSIVGGGSNLKPGEITMAHNGVLFLDEFPEFDRRVIESLRQPLEDKKINLFRVSGQMTLPANFILIIAMNPCPCGYYKSNFKKCICNQNLVNKYQNKISGPIIDRIDLWSNVKEPENLNIFIKQDNLKNQSSQELRSIVTETRKIQKERFINEKFSLNSEISSEKIKKYCELEKEDEILFEQSAKKLNLSIRSLYRILKISRTIADIEKSPEIKREHFLEALQYRPNNSLY
jgi:magnesium chelatase family protein